MLDVAAKLERLRNATDEATLDLMLDKLLNVIAEQYRQDLARYETALQTFEQRYQMSSELFYARFQGGQLSDDMDFFEWLGLVEMRSSVKQKLTNLDERG